MKKQLLVTSAVLCLLAAASIAVITAVAQQTTSTQSQQASETQSPNYRISGPYTHKNLTIFLLHGKDLVTGHTFLTLQEALAQKKVIVYETKDVNELAIRNLSNQDVYVQSGDIVRGGDQDRMISTDFIVPPKSGRMPIAAFCVESGRWNKRGNEVNASFASSENAASTREIKLAAKQSNSQQAVWEKVAVAQDNLSKNVGATVNSARSSSSLELAVENPKVKETTAAYINALSRLPQNKTDVIGYVFAINGQVNSADVYASRALFVKLWPKLLKASAVEAIAELEENAKPVAVEEQAVTAFLADSEDAKAAERDVTQRVRLVTREADRSIFFETRDRRKKDAWIHRNYIKK
ncbi:MAG TPA: DUF6569 family protein [Pyrinomonadaceae bacterium]|jgi:hypothetical protein|nr:DUF6569 family protein [Pyrinomonadaceae bacterium]